MNKRYRLSQDQKRILSGKIAATLKDKGDILFAYLFGSFIESNDFQDLDLGIYLSQQSTDSPLEFELKLETFLQERLEYPFDVRIINEAPLPFVYQVISAGKRLLDRSPFLRSDFEGLIFKKYFDFQHLRNEYLREILNASV